MHTHFKSLQKWMLCITVALSTAFFVSEAHAALRAKFALTAVVAGTPEEIRPGIFETKPSRIRITNKELLTNYLSLAYPSAATPGAQLGMDGGDFVILDSAGVVLDVVSDTILYIEIVGDPVQDGTENTAIPNFDGMVFGRGTTELAVDGANYFELEGSLQGRYRANPAGEFFSLLLKLSGGGSIGGTNSFVFGTVKWISTEL